MRFPGRKERIWASSWRANSPHFMTDGRELTHAPPRDDTGVRVMALCLSKR